MSKPDFIGLGAMKTGTTWLHQCLLEHPEINLAEKELNFFGDPATWSKGFDWYEKKLESDKKITGEFSVFYLAHPFVASRIHERYPNTKLIACLRNPIDRSFSHYLHDLRYGIFDQSLSFGEAIKKFPYLIEESRYSVFIKEYLKYFSSQQILLLIYEDSLQNPLQYIQLVYRFLGVDDQFIPPSLHKKIHPSYKPHFNLLEKFIYRRSFIRLVKKYWLSRKLGRVTSQLLFKLNKKPAELLDSDKKTLEIYFQSEIKELEKMIDRPLTQWL